MSFEAGLTAGANGNADSKKLHLQVPQRETE